MLKRTFALWFLLMVAACSLLLYSTAVAHPRTSTTYTVNSIADPGNGVCDTTECTLREAITAANSNSGLDMITFNIPGSGVRRIAPSSALPVITDPIIIDGYTQPGTSPNTLVVGNNAVLLVELYGWDSGNGVNGLRITAGNSVVRGLIIYGYRGGSGIKLETNGGNRIEGNFLGVHPDFGNSLAGVYIDNVTNNIVGGTTPAARNVLSSNTNGVTIINSRATGNLVQGNYIGTDPTGTAPRNNYEAGVLISNAPNNTVGGTAPGAQNLLSRNHEGITISGSGASGNMVQGNLIGTSRDGTGAMSNVLEGVLIRDAPNNLIGGVAPGAENVISANNRNGILITGVGSTSNRIEGNLIGTDRSGTIGLANAYDGVVVQGAPGNTIGGTAPEAGNLISGNSVSGIYIDDAAATGNMVQGNFIGTNISGTAALGNFSGVLVDDAPGNIIGGTAPGAGNLVSGNGIGIYIDGYGAQNTLIKGNLVGTNLAGTAPIGNGIGIELRETISVTVGGIEAGAGNLISGNSGRGVIFAFDARRNLVQGNYIGTDVTGSLALVHNQAIFCSI